METQSENRTQAEDACCNNCGGRLSDSAYSAFDSVRGLSIHVCESCGLAQSLPRMEVGPKWKASTASGAGWGNIRYGKSFRTKFAINLLEKHTSLAALESVLDIGSNRGHFLETLRTRNRKANLLGIEPDKTILGSDQRDEKLTILNDRIQNVDLPGHAYDLIYCSHTLEHLADPASALRKAHDALTEQGLLYLEVPNINIISNPSLIEEFFIDKHLYHYSPNTLHYLVSKSNFVPLELGFDDENIWVIARKVLNDGAVDANQDEPTEIKSLIARYASIIKKNRNEMKLVARNIENLSKGTEIFIWGAGRILDSLVTFGDFDVRLIGELIDKNLLNYIPEVHGKKLSPPSVLVGNDDITLIVASRAYFNEIRSEATSLNPRIKEIRSIFDFFSTSEV